MLDSAHLADPDPNVASLLAIAAVLHDYDHAYGRLAVAGVLPGIADVHADQTIDTIASCLDTAERLFEQEPIRAWAERLREEWIGHAKDAARSAIRQHRLVAA